MSFRSCEYRLAEGEKPLLPVDRVHKPFFFFFFSDGIIGANSVHELIIVKIGWIDL